MSSKNLKSIRVAIINDTRPTSHYGCLMVMKNLEALLTRFGAEVVWTWPVGVDWRKRKKHILNLPKVDAIIVNGEGTIHHAPRRWQAQALLEFASFAKGELKVPAYLINSTLYANNVSVLDNLKDYDRIYVRDRSSYDELSNQGVTCELVPDMTFAIDASIKYQPVKALCVVDSVMQSDLSTLKSFSKKNNADYCSMVVARPSNYSPWRKTRRFILETLKWFFKERGRTLNPEDFEKFLSQYQMIVTGRYHTVTMCLKNRIPFIALESNTPKISFLLKEVFGNSDRVISVKDLRNVNLNSWNSYTKYELRHIEAFINKAKDKNRKMIKEIVDQVS